MKKRKLRKTKRKTKKEKKNDNKFFFFKRRERTTIIGEPYIHLKDKIKLSGIKIIIFTFKKII